MKPKSEKVFFNGLNELRAFAALSVIFHHIELFKYRDDISSIFSNSYFNYFIEKLGKNGVYLFFVLSGFLITYLLLQEKDNYNKISFKKFYLRRIFRIWPLYYLVIAISFILIPFLVYNFEIFQLTPNYFKRVLDPSNYGSLSITLYMLFVPNFALAAGKAVVGAAQSWSIGVEEQFYLIWPLLLFLFNKRKLLLIFVCMLIGYILLNLHPVIYITPILRIVPFEFMAIGGIGAYFYYYKKDEIRLVTGKGYCYIITLLCVILLLSFKLPLISGYFQNICLGILFLGLILITINNDNKLVFRNKYFSFLGKISYGIYMYHAFVMFLVFPFANKYVNPNSNILLYNIIVYIFIISITIVISHLSYKYIESRFIKIKDSKYKTI